MLHARRCLIEDLCLPSKLQFERFECYNWKPQSRCSDSWAIKKQFVNRRAAKSPLECTTHSLLNANVKPIKTKLPSASLQTAISVKINKKLVGHRCVYSVQSTSRDRHDAIDEFSGRILEWRRLLKEYLRKVMSARFSSWMGELTTLKFGVWTRTCFDDH